MSFIRGIGRIARGRRGTTAMMFAGAFAAILPAVGFVVDYGMYLNHKTKVQSALDFASIAAAKYVSQNLAATDAEIETVANNLFKAEIEGAGYMDMQDVKVDRMGMRLNVHVEGEMPTTIMHLTSVDSMSLYTEAEVVYGIPSKAEIVLVLDTSESMSLTDGGETISRLESLKTAAEEMVTTLLPEDDDSGADVPIEIGLVPFSNRVNVGTGKRHKNWISVPADFTVYEGGCHIPLDWYESNCQRATGECNDDGTGNGCGTWICDPVEEANAEPVCSGAARDFKWFGCVEPRSSTYHLTDDDYSTEQIPGFMSVNDKECATTVRMLTTDADLLTRRIQSMEARSQTYIPSGLIWGYRMLTRKQPFTADKGVSKFMEEGGIKTIVLMSDGANTLAPYASGELDVENTDISDADPNTTKLCNSIKAEGVEIYVVAYNITDTETMELLESCASSASRFFTAESTDALQGAFKAITGQLSRDISLAG